MTGYILVVVFLATGFSVDFPNKDACERVKTWVLTNAPGALPKAECVSKITGK